LLEQSFCRPDILFLADNSGKVLSEKPVNVNVNLYSASSQKVPLMLYMRKYSSGFLLHFVAVELGRNVLICTDLHSNTDA